MELSVNLRDRLPCSHRTDHVCAVSVRRQRTHPETESAAYGVLGVIPGMIGCMQAAEVLKLLLGKGEPLIGKMLFIEAKTWSTDLIEVPVHPQCSCHTHTKVHRT